MLTVYVSAVSEHAALRVETSKEAGCEGVRSAKHEGEEAYHFKV